MSNANTLELGMLDLINAERADAGLDPLNLITLLNQAAETHSQWMLEADQFSHNGEGGSSPSDRMEVAGYPFEGSSLSAENIGWQSARGEEGFEDDVAQVHASLMNSPGHRANILNPDAEDIGLGVEIGTFSGAGDDFEAVMVTQVFGATDADISAWVDPGTGLPDEDVIEVPEDVIEDEMTEDELQDEPEVDETLEDEDVTDDDTVDEPEMETPEDDVDDPDTDAPDDGNPVDPLDPDIADDMPDSDSQDDPDAEPDDPAPEEPEIVMSVPLPCDLSTFTVDLSEAFEFTRDGDQLVWETSEDKLVETFMTAFEDWVANAEVPDTGEPDEMDISDLMLDGMGDEAPQMFGCDAVGEADEWLEQSCV